MSEKKYTIVRVQQKCPYYEVISKKCLLDLEDCRKECININGKFQHGDTKEQLVVKVAQILKQQMFLLEVYEDYIEAAKNIVEFLGVIE